MSYSTAQISRLFNVARETVRKWSVEFSHFLSPNATPGQGRTRQFTESDIAVFALVSEMKAQGKVYDDIHAALGAGQRGEIPIAAHNLIPADVPRSLVLQSQIRELEVQIKLLADDGLRKDGRIDELTRQLEETRRENDQLKRRLWRLEGDEDEI
ncbi:MAG: MerR family transcriptional regulator [Anaerolineae bacterium]|nr:MerR family transcriptional regulator [Anaerolineae bacterium]